MEKEQVLEVGPVLEQGWVLAKEEMRAEPYNTRLYLGQPRPNKCSHCSLKYYSEETAVLHALLAKQTRGMLEEEFYLCSLSAP